MWKVLQMGCLRLGGRKVLRFSTPGFGLWTPGVPGWVLKAHAFGGPLGHKCGGLSSDLRTFGIGLS